MKLLAQSEQNRVEMKLALMVVEICCQNVDIHKLNGSNDISMFQMFTCAAWSAQADLVRTSALRACQNASAKKRRRDGDDGDSGKEKERERERDNRHDQQEEFDRTRESWTAAHDGGNAN